MAKNNPYMFLYQILGYFVIDFNRKANIFFFPYLNHPLEFFWIQVFTSRLFTRDTRPHPSFLTFCQYPSQNGRPRCNNRFVDINPLFHSCVGCRQQEHKVKRAPTSFVHFVDTILYIGRVRPV